MPVAGNQVREQWTIYDFSKNPLTGMVSPADITFTLLRDVGAGFQAAPETVVMTEIGATGHYQIAYTPEAQGGLYVLQLKELNVNTFGQTWRFVHEVVASGSQFVPTFANAFCAETDVERWAQLAIDTLSKPSSDEVAGFAEARASEMRSILAAAGYTVPATVAPGSLEEDMLREANAIGAAADTVIAKYQDTEPARTDKGRALLEEYDTRMKRMVVYAARVLGSVQIRSPFTSGELTHRDEGSQEDIGLRDAIRMDMEF